MLHVCARKFDEIVTVGNFLRSEQSLNGVLQTFLTAACRWRRIGRADNERITLNWKLIKDCIFGQDLTEIIGLRLGFQAGRHRTSRCVTCPAAVAWRCDLSFILLLVWFGSIAATTTIGSRRRIKKRHLSLEPLNQTRGGLGLSVPAKSRWQPGWPHGLHHTVTLLESRARKL